MTVERWLQPEDTAVVEFVANCKKLNNLASQLEEKLINLLYDTDDAFSGLEYLLDGLEATGKLFAKVSGDFRVTIVSHFKCSHWREVIRLKRLSVTYLLHQVISASLAKYLESPSQLHIILKLIVFFDGLLCLTSGAPESHCTNIVRNTCPTLLHPVRKLTLTKILQVVAGSRAEEAAQQLVYALMYLKSVEDSSLSRGEEDVEDDLEELSTAQASDNSSMEVYRTLTENLSPVHRQSSRLLSSNQGSREETGGAAVREIQVLESLMLLECRKLKYIFNVMATETPDRLGAHSIKESKSKGGELRLRRRVKEKILSYYEAVLWGLVGGGAEYRLIWRGIGYQGTVCNRWAGWLRRLLNNPGLPGLLKPALQSLLDGLSVHISTVTWDFMFRKALVAAGYQNTNDRAEDYNNGTYAGLLFSDMFKELVSLSNGCEGPNWTVTQLEELPLTEQIPILHRLDHTVHSCRLWAQGKARQLAAHWKMDQFFRVTQVDVLSCLEQLENRHVSVYKEIEQYASQTDLLGPECSVHVMVCGKMRAKLVSEVNENVYKLKQVPSESIDVLSKVCRIFCLANLKLMFPPATHWRQNLEEVPRLPSGYVKDYLEEVLKPVILATEELDTTLRHKVSGLVLDIMCEAWLDHIYKNKIKFTEWGAMQLLADFGWVGEWLAALQQGEEAGRRTGEVESPASLRPHHHLVPTEMLRRCEGVGRLLLSQPGRTVPMRDRTATSSHHQDENDNSPTRMPPEMYVPNQSQWLELRANKPNYFSLCCGGLNLMGPP